jgi:hypothetical protein
VVDRVSGILFAASDRRTIKQPSVRYGRFCSVHTGGVDLGCSNNGTLDPIVER